MSWPTPGSRWELREEIILSTRLALLQVGVDDSLSFINKANYNLALIKCSLSEAQKCNVPLVRLRLMNVAPPLDACEMLLWTGGNRENLYAEHSGRLSANLQVS